MVAYGADILKGLDPTAAHQNIFKNGKKSLKLYEKGLKGPTTPEQRKYYQTQIVNLVRGLRKGLLSFLVPSPILQ